MSLFHVYFEFKPYKSVSKLEDSICTLEVDCVGSWINPDYLAKALSPNQGIDGWSTVAGPWIKKSFSMSRPFRVK